MYWFPNARVEVDKVTGRTPVPLKEEVWGELEALSVTVKVPLSAPVTKGVKVTEIAQLLRAARVLGDSGQVEVCAKSPDAAILVMVRGAV